jgi:dienelactone hydrolase
MAAITDPLKQARRVARRVPGAGAVQALPNTMRFMVGSQVRSWRTAPTTRPNARPSWAMFGQVAMDEMILGVMAASRMPAPDDYRRVGDELTVAAPMWRERGWDDDPASYHETPPPLSAVTTRWRRSRGMAFEQLSFESGYEPHPGEPGAERWQAFDVNHTAHAWVLRHPGRPRPWLICIHGMGMGMPMVDFAAFKASRLFSERGLNLLFPVLPLHGPRKGSRTALPDFPGYDQLDIVHGLSQGLWDIRRMVSWVQAQDAPQIGVHGISLGGCMTSLVASYEPGISSAIAGVPVIDFQKLMAHHADTRNLHIAESFQLLGSDAQMVNGVVSPLSVGPKPPVEQLAVYGGIGDRMATPAQAHLLWEHWGEPAMCWYPGNHVAFFWSSKVDQFVTSRLDHAGLSG